MNNVGVLIIIRIIYREISNDPVHCIFAIPPKQCGEKVIFCILLPHLYFRCNPSCSEIEMSFLECKFQHLQGFHQDRADTITFLCVCFGTWRENALWWNQWGLNGKVVKGSPKNGGSCNLHRLSHGINSSLICHHKVWSMISYLPEFQYVCALWRKCPRYIWAVLLFNCLLKTVISCEVHVLGETIICGKRGICWNLIWLDRIRMDRHWTLSAPSGPFGPARSWYSTN